MSRIEKLPLPLLRLLAKAGARMPRTILGLRYRRWTGRHMNWDNPENLQEYIFKNVIDAANNPEQLSLYTTLADKVAMRGFVAERIGEKYLPKLYGTWEAAADIDWDSLPDKFAIKTNNSCGTNIIVRDRATLDVADASRRLDEWLRFPYGQLSGQPQYSNIKPLILAEELLEETPGSTALPRDYKFFCFNGVPRFILYYEGREVNGHITPNIAYDTAWHKLDDIVNMPADHDVPAPEALAEMNELAARLSAGMPFVRVDFYIINGRPVVGELTFTPDMWTNFTPEFLREALKYINQ